MKQGIHPNWIPEAKISCACGASFVSGSTMESIRVDICSNCHPLYTGAQKLVDTLGQVDKFVKRTEQSKIKQEERKKIMEARLVKATAQKKDKPSLKDLLMSVRKSS